MYSSSRPLRVFLCHSSGDKPIVRDLYQKLIAEGWIDVWLDEQKLLPGMDWNLEIEKAVEASDVIMVCLSSNSVTKEGYVQRELRYVLDIALEKPEGTIFVIPLRLDNCEPPRRLRAWHYVDYFPENLRPWAYQRILESFKVRAGLLNLSTDVPKMTPHPSLASFLSSMPDKSEFVKPHLSTSTISSAGSATHPNMATGTSPIKVYRRLMVIFLLAFGFFGPWTGGPYGDDVYRTSIGMFIVLRFEVSALFFLTLVRLFPWKFRSGMTIVYLERLAAGIGVVAMALLLFVFVRNWSALDWGMLFTVAGIYLAALNIKLEFRSSKQTGTISK